MSRIQKTFSRLKKEGRKALVVYMTAGDPDLKKNEELVYAMEKDGVDLIELGVPFSDPLADGPVIQAASQRSLDHGTTLRQILTLVQKIRRRSQLPLVFMSYLNPILSYGIARFAKDAQAAGVDGVILPDVPLEEGGEISALLARHGIDVIYLLAPTSSAERKKKVSRASRGFVYFVSMTGITGSKKAVAASVKSHVRQIQAASPLPVCVGFGISTPEQAKAMADVCDGVIVGSAVVKALADNPKLSAEKFSEKFIRPLVKAVRGTR